MSLWNYTHFSGGTCLSCHFVLRMLLLLSDCYHNETQYSWRCRRRKRGGCGSTANGDCCSRCADCTSCYSEICLQEVCSAAWEPAARSVLCSDPSMCHTSTADWLAPTFSYLSGRCFKFSPRLWECWLPANRKWVCSCFRVLSLWLLTYLWLHIFFFGP